MSGPCMHEEHQACCWGGVKREAGGGGRGVAEVVGLQSEGKGVKNCWAEGGGIMRQSKI